MQIIISIDYNQIFTIAFHAKSEKLFFLYPSFDCCLNPTSSILIYLRWMSFNFHSQTQSSIRYQPGPDNNKRTTIKHILLFTKIRYRGNVSIVSNYQILPQKLRQETDWETLDILLSDGNSRLISGRLTQSLLWKQWVNCIVDSCGHSDINNLFNIGDLYH